MRRLLAASALLPGALSVAGCSGSSHPSAGGPSSLQAAPSSVAAASSPAATSSAGAPTQAAVAVENAPPGDIPDTVAYVLYRNAAGRYQFTHPEGWAEATHGGSVLFSDKLNGVSVAPGPATSSPTVATAQRDDVPALSRSQVAFELRGVTAVTVPAGSGVRIVYRRNSAPDPVTGRQYRDEVERYELVSGGREVVMELFGPVGSDNVDPYVKMVQSLRLS